jgi:hypothetical protein
VQKVLKKILVHFRKRRTGDILRQHYIECPIGKDITECCVPFLLQSLELFPFLKGQILDAAEAVGEIMWNRFVKNGSLPILNEGMFNLQYLFSLLYQSFSRILAGTIALN